MKWIAIITAMFILVGCEDRESARIRNEQKLPLGCKIIDLDYGDLKAAVVCENRKTTTLLRRWQVGKSTHYMINAEITSN